MPAASAAWNRSGRPWYSPIDEEKRMKALLASKAFIAGVVVALGIGAVAMVVSWTVDLSARDTFKTQDVRL
jgi:hypothetical protein